MKDFAFLRPQGGLTQSLMYFGFECISQESNILMSDLSFKKLEDIKIGDEVIGLCKQGTGKHYHLTSSKVLAVKRKGLRACVQITNQNNSLICTPDHKILSRVYDDCLSWREAFALKNKYVKEARPLSFPFFTTSSEFWKGWITGLMQGDGYKINHRQRIYLGIKSKDKLLLEVLRAKLEDLGIQCPKIKEKTWSQINKHGRSFFKKAKYWKPNRTIYILNIYRKNAVFEILKWMSLLPQTAAFDFLRGWLSGFVDAEGSLTQGKITIFQNEGEILEKCKQILRILELPFSDFKYKTSHLHALSCSNPFQLLLYATPVLARKKQIENMAVKQKNCFPVKIIDKGKMEVMDLTTETGNFIANGYVVHNCDDGWMDLLYKLCKEIQRVIDNTPDHSLDGFSVMQVKEKFGELAFYAGGYNSEIGELIDKAERKSRHTCEICGKRGSLSVKGGWYRTVCPYHRRTRGYMKVKPWHKGK